jgi:hypothetical protein
VKNDNTASGTVESDSDEELRILLHRSSAFCKTGCRFTTVHIFLPPPDTRVMQVDEHYEV